MLKIVASMFRDSTPASTETGESSGFQEYPEGLLDHLTDADDRVELDLFDNGDIMIGSSSHIHMTQLCCSPCVHLRSR